MQLFVLGEEVGHRVGDHDCGVCAEEYPEPCVCGGLMHATESSETDADGNLVLVTGCDVCGRSEDEAAEASV